MKENKTTFLNQFVDWWMNFYPAVRKKGPILSIENLDNPGWCIKCAALSDLYTNSQMKKFSLERSEENWIQGDFSCERVSCYGGTVNLHEILSLFLSGVFGRPIKVSLGNEIKVEEEGDMIEKLMSWYMASCDGDWEHEGGVKVEGLSDGCWVLTCDTNTFDHKGEKTIMRQTLSVSSSNTSWIAVTNYHFKCQVAPSELPVLLQIFLDYVNGE